MNSKNINMKSVNIFNDSVAMISIFREWYWDEQWIL